MKHLVGIRRRGPHWRAHVRVNGKLYSKQFPSSTPVREMNAWRAEQRKAFGPAVQPDQPRAEYKPQRASWIYFIQSKDHVKIGRTTNVAERLCTLKIGNAAPFILLATVPEGLIGESEIHQRFSHLRGDGEWFRLDSDLQLFIQSVCGGADLARLVYWWNGKTRKSQPPSETVQGS